MKVIFYVRYNKISIHSPLAGRDVWGLGLGWVLGHFNPLAPRGARRNKRVIYIPFVRISIHSPLAGRDL